jgi:hypothetical protein
MLCSAERRRKPNYGTGVGKNLSTFMQIILYMEFCKAQYAIVFFKSLA